MLKVPEAKRKYRGVSSSFVTSYTRVESCVQGSRRLSLRSVGHEGVGGVDVEGVDPPGSEVRGVRTLHYVRGPVPIPSTPLVLPLRWGV